MDKTKFGKKTSRFIDGMIRNIATTLKLEWKKMNF